jgi:hypothetical protein
LAASCTSRKLSCMHRPWMNAVWLSATSSDIRGARRCAMTLVSSGVKLWMRLIGRKSMRSTTLSFLGSRVIQASFRELKP